MPESVFKWAILTGEYPPQPGGVSDYTYLLSHALAQAGDEVHVWTTGTQDDASANAKKDMDVSVHRLPGGFGISGLTQLDAELKALRGKSRVLVQYVPHAFGWKAMNLPFCMWLSRRREPVWVMFHEVVFPLRWSQPPHHNLLGLATRAMAALLTRSSERIFVSTPAWKRFTVQPSFRQKSPVWLPVPSTIGENIDARSVETVRAEMASMREMLVGHFGTYGSNIRNLLRSIVPRLLNVNARIRFLFLGRGSAEFSQNLIEAGLVTAERIFTLDDLSPEKVRTYLAACDLALQPYPDGITTRRTSSMAALALGVPILTNVGELSEPIWQESGAVALVDEYSPEAFLKTAEHLLEDQKKRAEMAQRALALYYSRFSLEHTVNTLRALDPVRWSHQAMKTIQEE